MRVKNYAGEPALVCDREFCSRKVQLWFTQSKLGRAFVAAWLVLAIVGIAGLLVGCDPSDGKSETPEPGPVYTVIEVK